jgi:hypothetical protein
MFVIIAFVVGVIAEQMNRYRDQLAWQNRELLETNTRLESSQNAYEIANKKLNLLSSITRHAPVVEYCPDTDLYRPVMRYPW